MDSQNTLSRPPLLISRSGRRRFLISFICLTVIGLAASGVLSTIGGLVIDRLVLKGATGAALHGSVLKEVCVGLLFGATLGTAQWFELRRHLESSYLWILANSLGYIATSNILLVVLVTQIPSFSLEEIPLYIFSLLPDSVNQSPTGIFPLIGLGFLVVSAWKGFVIGTLQWMVLRRSLQSVWWWVLIVIASSTIASILAFLSIVAARFMPSISAEMLGSLAIVNFAISSVAYGIIQGVSLCACRRKIERIRS
jgi:hypothetical protein